MKAIRIVSGRDGKSFKEKNGKRILFATVPADGHFNPLTGLAKYLQSAGYDVRWYTQDLYREKLSKLGIPFYPFVKTTQINQHNFEQFYPERRRIRGRIARFRFDYENAYLKPGPEYFEDIREIYERFPFDLMIADIMFSGSAFVKDKLNVPVIAIGVMPLMDCSFDLAPAGLGITPAESLFGKLRDGIARFLSKKLVFSGLNRITIAHYEKHGIIPVSGNVLDVLYRKPSLVLQSGSPSFEYSRSDLHPGIHYVGPLYPAPRISRSSIRFDNLRKKYEKIILVTQGTIEKDPGKLISKTLEAYKNKREWLVVATTGGAQTSALREKYPQEHFIIEDFIPFEELMPYADVYISNGGYGGVLMSIKNKLPMVVAGVHEGKNEICARVGYFKIGINLRTENPTANSIKNAVNDVMQNPLYRKNISDIAGDFAKYPTYALCVKHIEELIKPVFPLSYIFAPTDTLAKKYKTA